MKIKDNYIVRNVAGENLVVPVGGKNINFNAVMTLNESAMLLWKTLAAGAEKRDLIKALTDEYGIDEARAAADIDKFLNKLKENDILED